jgi:nitrite reductase/ring-hydroxylating ferredoxin subunit
MSEINPARPAPGTVLIALDKIKSPGAVALDFRTGDCVYSIIVARDEHGVHAYDNECPHMRAPLERFDGVMIVRKPYLICAMHGASFRIRDGACVGGPALGTALKREEISVANGIVLLGAWRGPAA